MCNELERMAFCIWRITDLHLSPTSSFIFCSTSFEQPPRTFMTMLYWLTLYSGYRFASSSLSWLYFIVFSKSFDSPFSSHGQLISITLACLLVLSMTVASILLAFTWVVSANNGTSQKAVACSFSDSGLGVTCESHGSTLVMRSRDLRTSKNMILKTLLCLCRYLAVPVHYRQIDYISHSLGNPLIGGFFHQLLVILFFCCSKPW